MAIIEALQRWDCVHVDYDKGHISNSGGNKTEGVKSFDKSNGTSSNFKVNSNQNLSTDKSQVTPSRQIERVENWKERGSLAGETGLENWEDKLTGVQ